MRKFGSLLKPARKRESVNINVTQEWVDEDEEQQVPDDVLDRARHANDDHIQDDDKETEKPHRTTPHVLRLKHKGR